MFARVLVPVVMLVAAAAAHAAALETAPVERLDGGAGYTAEGAVEAVRETVLAAQLPGRITDLYVEAGDRVAAGTVLARIDARLAGRQAAASRARVEAARAQLAAAQQEYQRSRQLFEKNYISRAAFERAEAAFRTTEAAVHAEIAGAEAAEVGSELHRLTAPYAAAIADVDVALGDMALPGRALIRLYDPRALRVTVSVPAAVAAELNTHDAIKIEIPALPERSRWLAPRAVQRLPIADRASHTVELRLALDAVPAGLLPGMFARVSLPRAGGDVRLAVPARAVIRRTEVDAVYVVDGGGRAQLRQVRLGERRADRIEILAGLDEGERVALDPLAAAAQR